MNQLDCGKNSELVTCSMPYFVQKTRNSSALYWGPLSGVTFSGRFLEDSSLVIHDGRRTGIVELSYDREFAVVVCVPCWCSDLPFR